jgi:hypothetical protein
LKKIYGIPTYHNIVCYSMRRENTTKTSVLQEETRVFNTLKWIIEYSNTDQWMQKKGFKAEQFIFQDRHFSSTVFIVIGCVEPQHLVQELFTDEKFRDNFRLRSFFIGDSTRSSYKQRCV